MSERVARAFAQACARVHVAHAARAGDRGAAVVAAAAARAWRAAHDGHVCIRVDDDEARALAASAAVTAASDGGARVAPLVLDGDRLYLYRLHRAECGLARAIAALDTPNPIADPAHIERHLEADAQPADPDQTRAVRAALTRRVSLISGGPGTGKTTTLARLVRAIDALAPGARVALAAPTGKAAARLAQAISGHLSERSSGPAPGPSSAHAPGPVSVHAPSREALTVHALLGLRGAPAGEAPEAGPALAYDVVIVDEASMLDIELAAALAARIGAGARLVLAGDMDQLSSVEAGAVFAELCSAGLAGAARLGRNYRQRDAEAIVALASAVRESSSDDAIRALAERWLARGGAVADAASLATAALERYAPALDALDGGVAPLDVLSRYERHRVLCATRAGPLGTVALNAAIASRVRARTRAGRDEAWYPGRLVMVLRNDRDSGLFNGDVGVCADGEVVVFARGAGAVRALPALRMPACEDAWAITVHKSQGSEFDTVDFVPAPVDHPLATRELVYTAITRARAGLRIWGAADAIVAAAATRTRRDGRLAERVLAERVLAER